MTEKLAPTHRTISAMVPFAQAEVLAAYAKHVGKTPSKLIANWLNHNTPKMAAVINNTSPSVSILVQISSLTTRLKDIKRRRVVLFKAFKPYQKAAMYGEAYDLDGHTKAEQAFLAAVTAYNAVESELAPLLEAKMKDDLAAVNKGNE